MNIHTSIIAALALTGTLAGAPARAADDQQDARFEPTPSTCHALYRTVELERMMGQPGPGATFEQLTQAGRIRELPFWTFSNARHISFHQRQRALENSAGFDPEARPAVSITMPFRAGFPQGQPADGGGVIAPSRDDTPDYGRWLAQCDEAHDFTPVFWFGSPDPMTCASAFWILTQGSPETREAGMQGARAALAAQMSLHGGDPRALGHAAGAAGEARMQRVQSGAETVDSVRDDIEACNAAFGLQ